MMSPAKSHCPQAIASKAIGEAEALEVALVVLDLLRYYYLWK